MPDEAPREPRWISGSLPLWIGLAWGFAEATLFFIVPDLLISFVSLFNFKQSLKAVGCIVLGAVTGGALMFSVAKAYPADARSLVLRVPFVRPGMLQTCNRQYAKSGPFGIFKGPFSGIPYKAYAIEAPPHLSLPVFAFLSVPARLERFVLNWFGFGLAGFALRRMTPQWWQRAAVSIHVVFWTAVYAYYWTAVG